MFNKSELEQVSWSVLSAVWEPLHILVPEAPALVLPCSPSSPPKATAPLSDSVHQTGFPSFDNVCGKYEILSKQKLAWSHH